MKKSVYSLLTAGLFVFGAVAFTSCDSPVENQADQVEEAGEQRGEAIEDAAENQADAMEESADNMDTTAVIQ